MVVVVGVVMVGGVANTNLALTRMVIRWYARNEIHFGSTIVYDIRSPPTTHHHTCHHYTSHTHTRTKYSTVSCSIRSRSCLLFTTDGCGLLPITMGVVYRPSLTGSMLRIFSTTDFVIAAISNPGKGGCRENTGK